MRPGIIRRIAAKEILSTLRDRRAIISNLVLPLVLLPVIMMGMPLLLGGLFNREAASQTDLAVENLAAMPAQLVQLLDRANVSPFEAGDGIAAVRDDEAQVGLVLPEDFEALLSEGEAAAVQVVSKMGSLSAELNASKVQGAIDGYRQQIVGERLAAVGLDPSVLNPIIIQPVDASTDAERSSGQLSWIIPFFIAIWALAGGQMTAVDATAGEKERGTLESLLVSPVSRAEVVVGKFFATTLFSIIAAAMAIVGYVVGSMIMSNVVGSRIGGDGAEIVALMGGSLQVTPQSIVLLLVSALLLAGTISSLLLAISMFARSFKEAQTYVAPLSFLLVIPAVALQFKDLLDLGTWIYAVPLVNALMVMDDLVRGSIDFANLLVTWLSLLATITVFLGLAVLNVRKENVLFRT